MAIEYKVLGQSVPSATTDTELYATPSATSAVVATITVCNRAATADTFRIAIDVGDSVIATKDYLYYDVAIPGNETFAATLGITLATTDTVQIYAGTANLSFSAFGSEIT